MTGVFGREIFKGALFAPAVQPWSFTHIRGCGKGLDEYVENAQPGRYVTVRGIHDDRYGQWLGL